MKRLRGVAGVVVGVLLLTGLVRGAGMQLGALRSKAKKALETTGAKNNVAIDDEDGSGTPQVSLSSVPDIAPGSQAKLAATGRFGAKTTFTLAGTGFTLSDVVIAKNSFAGTVTVAPGTMPGAALLRARNRFGTGDARAAYVAGRWEIAGTTDNGWRVRMTPLEPKKPGILAFKAEIFEKAATTALITREAHIELQPQDGSAGKYTVDIAPIDVMAPGADAECDPVMQRAHTLAADLMNAKTQADQDRVSAEIDKIQDRIDTCVERQAERAGELAARMTAAAKQAETDASKFGCTSLDLQVAPGGAATGSFSCVTGGHAFTGTMTPAAR